MSALKNYGKISNGTWYLHVKAVDYFNHWSATKHFKIIVDSYKPKTYAPSKVSVIKGSTVTLPYKVNDPYSGGKVDVTLKVVNGSETVKNIHLGWVSANRLKSFSFKTALSVGSYTYRVYAKDKAGNSQANVASNSLTIKEPTPKTNPVDNPGGSPGDIPDDSLPDLPI